MSGGYQRLGERAVTSAIGLLVAALLLVAAVRLIESIWLPLVVLASVLLGGYGLFLVCRLVRRRRAGW